MVVSARIEASKIGVDILRKGGNAFDAMIATELALAVSYPRWWIHGFQKNRWRNRSA